MIEISKKEKFLLEVMQLDFNELELLVFLYLNL